jgi:hypothetical protein
MIIGVIHEKDKYRKINGVGKNRVGDQSVSPVSARAGQTPIKAVKSDVTSRS